MVALYLYIGWLLVGQMEVPNSAVRIILPAYALFGWLVVPGGLNSRIIRVSPHGVKVTNGPFPKGRRVNVKREDIHACTIREQVSVFRSENGTWAAIPNYLVGVETRATLHDVAYPYLKNEQAVEVGRRIAAALNADPALPAIPLRGTTLEPASNLGWRMRVLLWGGLFIAATLVGAYWELSSRAG